MTRESALRQSFTIQEIVAEELRRLGTLGYSWALMGGATEDDGANLRVTIELETRYAVRDAGLARPTVADDGEVRRAAERLIEGHALSFGESHDQQCADMILVARAALVAGERESRLRDALLALSGGGLSAPCWCGRLRHTPVCDQAHEALAASGTATHPFLPRSGSQDTSGQYRRCGVADCDLTPEQHA